MKNIPKHIAIIMDGNGRWAKSNHLPIKAGHKKGAAVAKEIAKAAKEMGVRYLTLYTFSSENWLRPKEEVNDLMSLLRSYLKTDLPKLMEENVRLRFIGDKSRLDQDIQELMKECEEQSKDNEFILTLAISYGARDEIVNAALLMAQDIKEGKMNPSKVTSEGFSKYLYTYDLPDPDLFIRTSGDKRISNFLLWQIAYTELYFTNKYWPDFASEDLESAVEEFGSRNRTYGER